MKDLAPYILLRTNTDKTTDVQVNDWELFDFIEDYLIEDCDIEYEYFSESKEEENTFYIMHFASKYKATKIESFLSKLNLKEIKEIYLLNNSPIPE